VPELLTSGKNLISDYTFEKDSLFARVNLNGDELEMYFRVHAALAEKIPLPDLVVYLRASTSVLMQRITSRDRPYERAMQPDYIETLNQAYDAFYLNPDRANSTLVIDTNQMDFVHHADALNWMDNRIRQTLHLPPFQPELPISTQK